MKHFISSTPKRTPITDDQAILAKVKDKTEKYRTHLFGEMKLFDLQVCLKLAELNKAQKKDKKKIAECNEFIRLMKNEVKYVSGIAKKEFTELDDFEEAMFSDRREQRIKRLNQLIDKVLGPGHDLNQKIEKNSELDRELAGLKEKISAVMIVINILNGSDSDASKLSQIAYHAKTAGKRDVEWNRFWKSVQLLENKLASKKSSYQRS